MPITPAPFAPVAYCVEATLTGRYTPTGTKMLNRLSFSTMNEEPTITDTDAVANMVAAWAAAGYSTVLCTFVNLDNVVVKSRATEEGPYSAVVIDVNGVVAVNNTAGMDPAWAPLALLNCGLTGRRHHGRVFSFTPSNADMPTNSTYGDAILNAWIATLADLKAAALSAGYPLVIASRTYNDFHAVTDIEASHKMTMQTRRRAGFGEF